MSCTMCLASIATVFSSFFWGVNERVLGDEIIIQGQTVNMIVPEKQLAPGSVKVVSRCAVGSPEWKKTELEAYDLINKIIGVWKQQGISDYLIYRKETDSSKSLFSWEIVPYRKEGWRFWKMFKVLWNITFDGSFVPKIERERVAKDYQKQMESFTVSQSNELEVIQSLANKKDAFCDPKVIERQLVLEGREVYVLYNYAPIRLGEQQLHFLVIPKKHRLGFSDLTPSEYLEINEVSDKLVNHYLAEGSQSVYLFSKLGIEAGQTVPHWHQNIVFVQTDAQEIYGRLWILKNMIFGSSALPQNELKHRVEKLRKELSRFTTNCEAS